MQRHAYHGNINLNAKALWHMRAGENCPHHEHRMKYGVRKYLTTIGVVVMLGLLASGKAESRSMPAAHTAQEHAHPQQQHPYGKSMPPMQMTKTFIEAIEHHGTSGTSAEPNSTPIPMLMTSKDKWMHFSMLCNRVVHAGLTKSSPRIGLCL